MDRKGKFGLEPKILVISNNSFSKTKNNGKTLASLFKGYSPENICQLYFSNEIPTEDYYKNYFRISDNDMLNYLIKREKAGKIISSSNYRNISKKDDKYNNIRKLKKYNLFRIGREILWNISNWETPELYEWLDKFNPDIIFFCAGDSEFAYNITNQIRKKYNTKLVVYVTDDYILPRKTLSISWWIRRNRVYKKMESILKTCDLFITISEQMRIEYKKIFGVDSILAMNTVESFFLESENNIDNARVTFIYAGGLHFKRYETLNILAKAILEYNNHTSGKKAILKIYSESKLNKKVKNMLNIEGASIYCGSLGLDELKVELNRSDIPVHVESFNKKCIESTKLSISTKIPEYLSLKKPILAIGPKEVASMKYLSDVAFCITENDNIYGKVEEFIRLEESYKEKLVINAVDKYQKNHQYDLCRDMIEKEINRLIVGV